MAGVEMRALIRTRMRGSGVVLSGFVIVDTWGAQRRRNRPRVRQA